MRGHPRKGKKLHHSDDEDSDEAGEESEADEASGDDSGDADEFESLVQEFTYHKGEKVRVWWESEGVWLIDKVMAKSVEVYYEDLESEPDFYARHNLRSSKMEKVIEK